MSNRRETGDWGEKVAAEYLQKQGYRILTTNFRCKIGEIDIIAKDQEYIVFIEVKYRKDLSHGLPREAVTYYKQRTIIKVAMWYLKQKHLYDCSCRFDVIEILGGPTGLTISLIKDAFRIN